MALFSCSRLASKSMFASLSRLSATLNTAQYASAAGVPKLTFKKFEVSSQEHHEVKNERLQRPLSPHLTIYKFPFPAMLSITHRGTGIILSVYTSALGIGALCLPNDVSHYITMIEGLNLSPATLFIAKALIAAPVGYHLANGLRHLYWDTAKGLTMREVYTTGYGVLAVGVALTLLLAAL